VQDGETVTDAEARLRRRPGWSRNGGDSLPNRVVRIGRSLISSNTNSAGTSRAALPLGGVATEEEGERSVPVPGPGEGVIPGRTIRFHDEQVADKAAVGRIGNGD
jgi:hypothetical protein